MKPKHNVPEYGFTLIETIVVILILAIAASMMASYFGTALVRSSSAIVSLNKASGLNNIMEKITAQYMQVPHWSPNTAYPVNTIIIPLPKNNIGFQYISTSGGTTGANEPGWPNNSGESAIDGGVTWLYNGNAPTLTGPAGLQAGIGAEGTEPNNTFGNYRVVQNRFVKFDDTTRTEINIDGSPGDDQYGRYLKVTIGQPLNAPNRTSETLTTLFVKR